MSDYTDESSQFFFDAMQDVKPIKQDNKVQLFRQTDHLARQLKRQAIERELLTESNYLSIEKVEPLDPFDMLSYKKDGVQQGVFKNLRLGKYKIDHVINLQHRKFNQARQYFFESIVESQQQGKRALLVQHGLGINSKPFPAFLKSYVNQWLRQMPQVLAFHSALKHHGGMSALYVLIKKNDEEKSNNRELHRKR